MTYSEIHTPWVDKTWETLENALQNTDGAKLYEIDDGPAAQDNPQ